jgi:hypothetical protein
MYFAGTPMSWLADINYPLFLATLSRGLSLFGHARGFPSITEGNAFTLTDSDGARTQGAQ